MLLLVLDRDPWLYPCRAVADLCSKQPFTLPFVRLLWETLVPSTMTGARGKPCCGQTVMSLLLDILDRVPWLHPCQCCGGPPPNSSWLPCFAWGEAPLRAEQAVFRGLLWGSGSFRIAAGVTTGSAVKVKQSCPCFCPKGSLQCSCSKYSSTLHHNHCVLIL